MPIFARLRSVFLVWLIVFAALRVQGAAFTTPLVGAADFDNATARQWVDGVESSGPFFANFFYTQTSKPSATGSATTFGTTANPGPRHVRWGFTRTITVGSVLVFGDVEPTALRADVAYPGSISNDAHWVTAQRLSGTQIDSDGRLSTTALSVWVFPEPVQTRALRFTKVARETDPSYFGRISGVHVFSERFANVAPQATLYASAGAPALSLVNNENTIGRWENAANGGPEVVSTQFPEKLFFTWPNQVTLAGLCFHYPGFTEGFIQRFIGSDAQHPRDAGDADWETVKTFADLRWQGANRSFGIELVEFPEAQTSRAFRVVITRAGDPVAEPGLGTTTFGGKKVWLNEGMALFALGAAPLADAIVARACDLPAPISIPFTLPQAGYVTLVIEDAQGNRVRNLIGETFYPAGDNVAHWDGLDESGRLRTGNDGDNEVVGALVAAGTYRARGLVRDELNLHYEFTVNTASIPPWLSADIRSGWVSDHRPPSDIAFIAASSEMLITAEVGEASPNAVMTDLTGRVTRNLGAIEEGFYRASHMAQDMGPQRNATIMLYSAVLSRSRLYVHSMNTSRATTRLLSVSGYDPAKFIGGLAAWNQNLYLSVPASNVIHVINGTTGAFLAALNVPNPRGLAFQADGKLLVLSGNTLKRFAAQTNPFALADEETLVTEGLDDPQRVIVQAGTGEIYVSNWGAINQVKVFSSSGAFLRSIGRAGPLTVGLYDETQMHRPAGMALAPDGKLWVAEYDMAPKRVSIWLADGSFSRAFYGPPKYGGGGRLDPVDKTRFYYTDADPNDPVPFYIGMEWRLNWETGANAPFAIYSRSGTNLSTSVLPVMPPETAVHLNGRQYMINSWNADDTGGNLGIAGIWEMVGNVARPVAATGPRTAWAILMQPPFHNGQNGNFMFVWSDLNGDYTAQPEEVQYRTQNFGSYQIMDDLTILTSNGTRVPRSGFAPGGAPTYALASATQAITGAPLGASDVTQLVEGSDGWHVLTGGPIQGFKNGARVWTYPSRWPSLHSSQKAPATTVPRPPGMMIGTTRLLGDLFAPSAGEAGEIWTINGNKGDIYMLTTDGLFIGRLFNDVREAPLWATPPLARGTLLNDLTLSEEDFWPSVSKTADGNIYLVAGDNHSSIVRVEGLNSIRRLPAVTFEVTNELLAQCVAYRTAVAACQVVNTDQLNVARPANAPIVDGNHTEWDAAAFVNIDPQASGAVMVSQGRLYAAWKTESATLPNNTGLVPNAIFKTGGALDLMIGTDPQASPTRTAPALGDIRLSIARVNNTTKAFLYRPAAPNPNPVTFTSPVRSITFARIDDVSADVQFAGASGRFEISIPLTTLGLNVVGGMQILGDIGVLRGPDGVTIQRSYWHNEATGLVSDTPTESELTPQLWGRWVFQGDAAATLDITTTSPLPAGQIGSAYNLTLAATGGTPDYTWSVTGGALPAGIVLSSSGVLSGAPSGSGNFSFTARVTDSVNTSVTRTFALTINNQPLVITTGAAPAAGQVGTAYSLQFAATGGAGGYTWAVSAGTLPGGLTLSASGLLNGTPAAAGTFNFTVRVTDSANAQTTKAITLIVNPPGLAIVTASLPNGTRGTSYSQTLVGSGGTPSYTWTLAGGALPPSLSLATSGQISGTATQEGTFNFTVRLTDSAAVSVTRDLSITIMAPPLAVATSSLSDGVVGTAYNANLAASGGQLPYTWTVTSGTLPPGLGLSAAGALQGTPSTPGTFNFTVRVSDAGAANASRTLNLVIAPAPLAITTASLPGGAVSASYSQAVVAAGGVAPRTFSISAGSLPSGLTISAAGVISGTPLAHGTFNFTVRVTDSASGVATRALSIVVSPAALTITTSNLPGGTVGAIYSQALAGAGGIAPYTWAISAGTLPGGLSFSAGGVISGTPGAHGTFNFTVRLTDSANTQTTRALSIVVAPAALTINTTSLPGGTVGVIYSQTMSAAGGVQPYAWSVSAGALPNGVNLTAGGVLSGNPSAQGTFNLTVRVQDSLGASQTRSLSLVITPAPLVITTESLPGGVVGAPYGNSLNATGGVAPYVWTLASGSLPVGVAVQASGILAGTPTARGTFNFTLRVSDAAGVSQTRAFAVTITPPPLEITTNGTLPAGVRATLYSQTLAATGGVSPYSWTLVAGALPPGVTLNTGGVLSGTPNEHGTFQFTAQAADSLGTTAMRQFTLVIDTPPLVVVTSALSDAVVGRSYGASAQVSGGAPPITWSISAGALPPGINFTVIGIFSGTPTQQGTFNFTVRAQDSVGNVAIRNLSILVQAEGFAVTTAALPAATQGLSYSHNLVAVGGQTPYTWTLTAGALPNGMSLSANGALAGSPTASGSFTFTVEVADDLGETRAKEFTLLVHPPVLTITTTSPLRAVTVNAAVTRPLLAIGGEPPYTWTHVSGVIPDGMTFDPAGGLSGTPTIPASYTFLARVTDSGGRAASREFLIMVTPMPLSIPAGQVLATAFVTEPYSGEVTASGGIPPYTWALNTGVLPAGVSVVTGGGASGFLSGAPTLPGTFNFTLRVQDSAGFVASRGFALQVNVAPLAVVTASLPIGQVGVSYSGSLGADKGLPPYAWSLADGALPPGLSLNAAGEISGTPSGFGNFNFRVRATDAQNTEALRQLNITIAPAPLVIPPIELPGGMVGQDYGASVAASGGVGNYRWTLASGELPEGVLLEPTGFLTGVPEARGAYIFELEVADGADARATRSFLLVIAPAPVVVQTEALPEATARVSYLHPLVAEGGVPPFTWQTAGGALPAGMSLSGSGVLAGTPSADGDFTFTVRAVDSLGASAERELELHVAPPLLTIVSGPQLRSVTVNANANRQLETLAGDGTAPFTWSVTGGAIPPGMTFSTSGLLSGAANSVGAFTFTARVQDSTGRFGARDMRIFVNPAPLQISPNILLAVGTVTESYSNLVFATGGTLPYQWALNTGTLPPGLSVINLAETNGAIVGIPTAPGTFSFTLRVTEASGFVASRGFALSIVAAPPEFNTIALPAATRGVPLEVQFSGRRGVPPYTWSISEGTLPPGLGLSGDGLVSGTPSAGGTFNFTLSFTDAQSTTISQPLQWAVDPGLSPRDQWRQERFGANANQPMAEDGADPDGDALANIVEYAFGLDPLTPDANGRPRSEIRATIEGRFLALTHRKATAATDVVVVIEASPDAATWTASVVEVSRQGAGVETIVVRDTIPLDQAAKRFLRLNVVPQAP